MGTAPYGKDAGIAKILKRDGSGRHGGMAIMIDRRHVVTCAHVVNAALGLPIEAVAKPTEPVPVAFPLWTRRDTINGRLVAWHPIGCGSVEDVAVLELEADAPVEIGTVYFEATSIRMSNSKWHLPMRSRRQENDPTILSVAYR
jgi:hypothetical protein